MAEFSKDKIQSCKMEIIYLERKNIRTNELSDAKMVDKITKAIASNLQERY